MNVLLDDLGDPKVPDRMARRFDRVAAASSQEVVLVPITSITR